MSQATPVPASDDTHITVRKNDAALHLAGPTVLSVVVPFFAYDVRPLAQRLDELAKGVNQAICMVFLDDGSRDAHWAEELWQMASTFSTPTVVGVLKQNAGRARIRNHLCHLTESPYLLYLDADMWPDQPDFLAKYVGWLSSTPQVDVIYGGRSADKVILDGPDYKLHATFTKLREQIPASVRRASPAYTFYSCNFLVRREILLQTPLNAAYTGWGWEDCEWAMRVIQNHQIRHEDNPASHLGLLTCEQILRKYDESVGNFSLFYGQHPDVVQSTMLVRIAKLLGYSRLEGVARFVARQLAQASWLPIKLQLLGLMLYKSALYAPVVTGRKNNIKSQ